VGMYAHIVCWIDYQNLELKMIVFYV
jgi:hypothetical protein